MTEAQRDEVLLKLLAFAQKTDAKLVEHDRQFEEISIELKNINTKLAEHDRQFEKISIELKNINTKLAEHDRQFEKISVELKNINTKLAEHDRQFEKINIELKNINTKLAEHDKQLQSINHSVVLIEVEYKDKLSALFDAFQINSEKINEFHKDFKNIHSVLDEHEDQIFLLKQK